MLPYISYLGIGSNLGDRINNIKKSIKYLNSNKRIRVKEISSIYETLPEGGPKNQPKYLNAVVKIKTSISPFDLLKELKIIEKKLKRKISRRWAPRTMDLDILFFNDLVFLSDKLTIPHPLLHKRIFVLKPLMDIAPDLIHPSFGKNIKSLLKKLHRNNRNKSIKLIENENYN